MSQVEVLSEPESIEGSPPIENYRAVSFWAIIALGLGLLSGIFVLTPLLGFIPLAAMAVGGYALRQISVDSERLSGRWMAITPLILAPLFLGWGLSQEFTRRERMYGYAREFADEWLSVLNQKESHLAHQLKLISRQRVDFHSNMEVAYQTNDAALNEYQTFIESSPTKEILAAAPNVSFQFVEFAHHSHHGFTDTVTMQYVYETPAAGKNRFWITAQRIFNNYTGRADWNISEISTARPRGV